MNPTRIIRLLPLVLAAIALVAPAAAPAHSTPGEKDQAPFVNIAHRGLSGLAPEHTFPAYELALEHHADYLEQDVQLTADGHLVVIHDPHLDRTMRGPVENCTGLVATKTLAQLKTCDAGSWFNETYPDLARPEYVGLEMPTMREVFERYGESVNYHIETKSPADTGRVEIALLDLINEFGLRDAAVEDWQVLIQSFEPTHLETIHLLDPEFPLIQLTPVSDPLDATLDAIASYAVGVAPSHEVVDAGYLDAAHERCLVVHPYTVDDRDRMKELLRLGVDGLFTNRADILNEVLDRKHPTDDAALAAEANRACA